MGDPAGIGPEVALKALPEVTPFCQPQLIGARQIWQQVADQLGLPLPADATFVPPQVGDDDHDPLAVFPGKVCPRYGRASFAWVDQAITMTRAGQAAAMVTGPIHKEAWHAAGVPFHGHTEMLAARTGTPEVRMMLTSPEISCVLATVHVGYDRVPSLLTTESLLETISIAHRTVSRLRDRSARIAVCGLNPHAGEHGLFGNREEERIIAPAIEQARQAGLEVTGPLPPDTAFTPDRRRQTDVFVCMYHDQGLIPLKALAFDDAVNVTLNLPIVRTSVDHGTAMDLAWQGVANHHSMIEAIRLAVKLATPID